MNSWRFREDVTVDDRSWIDGSRSAVCDALTLLYPTATDLEIAAAAEAVLDLIGSATTYLGDRTRAELLSLPAQEQLVDIVFGSYRLDPARVEAAIPPMLVRGTPAWEVQRIQIELESALGAPVEAWDGGEVTPRAWERFRRYLAVLEGEETLDTAARLGHLAADGSESASPVATEDTDGA